MIQLLSLLLPLLLVSSPAGAYGPAERLAQLRAVMTERLALMEGVARFKWNARLPVEDIARAKVPSPEVNGPRVNFRLAPIAVILSEIFQADASLPMPDLRI